jgi:hypothetical protein
MERDMDIQIAADNGQALVGAYEVLSRTSDEGLANGNFGDLPDQPDD